MEQTNKSEIVVVEDLSEIVVDDTFEYQLRHPKTGEGLDLYFTLYGPDSAEAKAAHHKVSNRRMGSRTPITSELLDAENIDLLVMRTKSIRGGLTFNGESIKDTPDGYRALYRDRRLNWARVQVDNAMSDRANYLGE